MGVVAAPTAKRGAIHTAILTTITTMHIWDRLTRMVAEVLCSAPSLSTLIVPTYLKRLYHYYYYYGGRKKVNATRLI